MMTDRMEISPVRGAYIHIPFCDHICYYCDFNKFFMKNQPVDAYLQALDREMAFYARKGPVQTIYIGGGTPTALSDNQLERMLEDVCSHFMSPAIKEFTVEANPENLSDEKLQTMKRHGVTRLSIGVQSFDDRLLQSIGRAHRADEAKRAVRQAQDKGFDNITIDLMFALPGQTETLLRQSLAEALELDTPHISIYSLQVEPKTIFYNRLKTGKLSLPGEDLEADMYGQIILELGKNGLKHYEISNFARPGYEGVHNSLYWKNEEYYGIGAGAHGYVERTRYANAGPIKTYLAAVGKNGCGRVSDHPVTRQERIEEEMFLGLRLMQGVSKDLFLNKFGCPMESIYGQQINDLKKQGLIENSEKRIRLSQRGIFLGNNVFEAFLLS